MSTLWVIKKNQQKPSKICYQPEYRHHTSMQSWKILELWKVGKTLGFLNGFRILNARAARFDFISMIDHFCKPKSSCFLRETAVKRIAFFVYFSLLYVVYRHAPYSNARLGPARLIINNAYFGLYLINYHTIIIHNLRKLEQNIFLMII